MDSKECALQLPAAVETWYHYIGNKRWHNEVCEDLRGQISEPESIREDRSRVI